MGKKRGEELKNSLAVTADQCVSGFVQMFLCSVFCCCHYLDVLTLALLQHHPQKLLLLLAVGAGRFGVTSACVPLQDVERSTKSPLSFSCCGEVSAWHHKQLVAALGGAGGAACYTRVGAQRRKKLEPRIPAGCRERSVIC